MFVFSAMCGAPQVSVLCSNPFEVLIIDNDLQRVKPKDDLQNLTLNPLTQTTYIDFVLVHVNKNPFHQTTSQKCIF